MEKEPTGKKRSDLKYCNLWSSIPIPDNNYQYNQYTTNDDDKHPWEVATVIHILIFDGRRWCRS